MKNILLFILAAFCMTSTYGQRGSFILSYPIAFPMADLHDYIGKTSFRGISFEFNKRQRPDLDIGLEIGWNVFYERVSTKTYSDGTASISGVQYRYTNSVPILAGAKYYFGASTKRTHPYAGLGIGTLYANRATDFGLYRITNEAWQFCLRPEAGAVIGIKPGLGALVGLKYYAAFNANDLDGQSFLSLNIGLVFLKE